MVFNVDNFIEFAIDGTIVDDTIFYCTVNDKVGTNLQNFDLLYSPK